MQRTFSIGLLLSGLILASGCGDKDSIIDDDTGSTVQDADGDGFDTDSDCDDQDAQVFPGAEEVCDEKDNDCDGEVDEDVSTTWYPDLDGDGWGDEDEAIVGCDQPSGTVAEPGDCDDGDAESYPGADERCDGLDNDCDGEVDNDPVEVWYVDADGDGYGNAAYSQNVCDPGSGWVSDDSDCDDIDPEVHPGAEERCNGVDDDCDALIDDDDDSIVDQDTWYLDVDADGYGLDDDTVLACQQPSGYAALPGDCDDRDAAFNPGAEESDCTDPTDYNCDGSVGYVDADGDGFAACEECDDGDAAQFPGADELCNGEDDDCDGATDEDDAIDVATWYADADGDGYGEAITTALGCEAPSGFVADDSDCDDRDAAQFPGADELCNGEDDDCDGATDEGDAIDKATWYADRDGDGYGDPSATDLGCDAPRGYVADDSDCDDGDASVHPAAIERCDSVDNDCDGTVDEDDAVDAATWYADDDADGYGDPIASTLACEAPSGYLADGTDCDDNDDDIHPGATELCNGFDDDCDGATDEDDAADVSTWFADVDGDGYGDTASSDRDCDQPSGYVADDSDCDDSDASINPRATEACDGVDNDCDGLVDDDDSAVTGRSTWYLDYDGDSYGDVTLSAEACDQPSGYVADATDCDDRDASAYPGGDEYCDGVDNDCDGTVDEDDALDVSTWYLDGDADGFGDASSSRDACSSPSGYVADGTDCDDGDAGINPGATEVCNGSDDDCDGTVDEDDAADVATWYADADSDGYGDAATSELDCDQPSGFVADDADCDDGDAGIHPAAAEICDGVDNDCDGLTDDDDSSVSGGGTWYLDDDGDGYGDPGSSVEACELPSGYLADDSDCDDGDAGIHPGATEICDGVDNDCDGDVDDDDADITGLSIWYLDADGDGYGVDTDSLEACFAPTGYVAVAGDCDDDDASVWEDCNPFHSFDGSFASSWETLTYPSGGIRGFQSYHSEDDWDVIYHLQNTTNSYYDPSTDTWTTMSAAAPYGSYWAGLAPWDGLLWSVRNGAVYSYDPATDVWTTVATTSWSDDQGMTVADEDGVLYGYDANGNIAVYDTATGTQTSYATGLGSEYETRLGYDPISRAVYFGAFHVDAFYKFDIATGAVSSVTAHPEGMLNDIFCSDNSGHIYAAGSSSGTTVWQYDIATDNWSAIPDLPSDHGNNHSCVVSDSGWLYMGGSSGFYRLALY